MGSLQAYTGTDTFSQQFRDATLLQEAMQTRLQDTFDTPGHALFGCELEVLPCSDGEFILHLPEGADRTAAEYEFLSIMERLLQ